MYLNVRVGQAGSRIKLRGLIYHLGHNSKVFAKVKKFQVGLNIWVNLKPDSKKLDSNLTLEKNPVPDPTIEKRGF